MSIRILEIALLSSAILITACAKATKPPGLDGSGGDGGDTASSSGTGGAGGMADAGPDIDPLDGISPVTLVLGGFQATDSPLWVEADGVLLFTDPPSNKIHSLTPPSTLGIFREPSGNAAGIALNAAGLLVACERSARRVSRTLADQTVVDLAIGWNQMKLNSPEDVIGGPDNSIYFTDPPFGLPSPGSSELGFFGVFWVDPNGMMSLVANDMPTPNGIALSPDNKNLYVVDTQTTEVRVFPVAGFGQVGMGMKLMNTSPGPDGMCVDDAGNLYIATSVGVEVYRANGMLRGKIDVPEVPTSCSFGGADRQTMYITAGTSIYRVDLKVPGLP